MKKTLIWFFIVLMAVSLIAGCAVDNEEPQGENGNNVNEGNENEGNGNEGNENEGNENNETGEGEEQEISKTGVYMGQIDNSSIEIEVDGESMAFRLTEETRGVIEELNENDQVDVTYYSNEHGQNILVTLAKKDMAEEENVKTDVGTYKGQLDNSSIEVEIEGESKSLVNYEMEELLEGIEKDDKVEVKYSENEQGQLDFKSIKKVE